jgi:hypothetical protein
MTGRYFVLIDELHFHTVLPPENVGEKTSVEPLILLLARCGVPDEKCAVIRPAAVFT